jgi:V/A-type H+/Na+-transporting ATPase subunit E
MSDKGVENIIAHIETKAENEISELLSKARKEAENIKNLANQEAEVESEKVLSHAKRSASLEGQRILAETKIQVRRKMMDSQEKAISKSFNEAKDVLRKLAENGKEDRFVYKDILFDLIASGSEILDGDNLELALNKEDSKTCTHAMLEEARSLVKERTGRNVHLSLSKEPMTFIGGVVVRDTEKAVEVDNSLETRLNRLRESIRVDVAKILFGENI